jgi:hypothetical protein
MPSHSLLYGQCCVASPLSVVLKGNRRPKERHHPVTRELIDGPLIQLDLLHEDLEAVLHDLVDFFGVSLLERLVKFATSANKTVTSLRSPSMEVRVVRILSARCFGV